MDAIISAVITGIITLMGTIITVILTNNKTQAAMDKRMVVMETQVKELTREVRAHNGFATRLPVVENDIKTLYNRVDKIDKSYTPSN